MKEEARYDGKWVCDQHRSAGREVAFKYKQLWMVEAVFRSMKSLLETRPIFHQCDETIRGHVFCSFLALVLRKELEARLKAGKERNLEWADMIHDLAPAGDAPSPARVTCFAVRPKEPRARCSRPVVSRCRRRFDHPDPASTDRRSTRLQRRVTRRFRNRNS